MTEQLTCLHLWVVGRVQGVGFRAFVAWEARLVGVTGWVRNLGYDQVEILVEGAPESVEQFTQRVKVGPSHSRVDEVRVEVETPSGSFTDFQIRSTR